MPLALMNMMLRDPSLNFIVVYLCGFLLASLADEHGKSAIASKAHARGQLADRLGDRPHGAENVSLFERARPAAHDATNNTRKRSGPTKPWQDERPGRAHVELNFRSGNLPRFRASSSRDRGDYVKSLIYFKSCLEIRKR
jgi:hypothetical protein